MYAPPQPPQPPGPPWPPRPPRRPWYTNFQITLPVSMVAVFAAICAATMVIVYADEPRTGTLSMDPGAAFAAAPAVDLTYTYTAKDGTQSTGRFTITDDGYATGTINDQFAGAATMHTTPEGSAVWGDSTWWERRAPAQASHVNDQWVQPDSGTALPIDMAAEFNPEALTDLIRSINDSGTPDADINSYQGIPAVALTWQDWTLVRTSALPTEVLSLSGPIDNGLFHTAAAPRATVVAVQAVWDGNEADTGHAQDTATLPPRIDLSPAQVDAEFAKIVKDLTGKTLNGQGQNPTTAPDPDAPSAPAEAEPPPATTDFPVIAPEFTATINATECWSATCSWSATVQNVGNGPGDATVTASATPGMGAVTHTLGTIPAGGSGSTSTMSFSNPAPTPSPGQTTSVMVLYSVVVYAPQIGGSNAARYQTLVDRLGGMDKQPALDRILRTLDTAAKDVAVEAMHDMLDAEVPVEDTLDAMDQATQADPAQGEYAETPMLRQLVDAGDRFTSWSSVAPLLQGLDSVEMTPYMPGIATAVEALADPAEPTVSLTYLPGAADAPMDAVVVSEYPTPEEVRCTGITTVPNGGLAEGIDRAVGDAAGAAEGCKVTARIVVPEDDPALWNATAPELVEGLRAVTEDITICGGDTAGLDDFTIVNGLGPYTLPAAAACSGKQQQLIQTVIDTLNGMDLDPSLLQDMKTQGLVTVDADGKIDGVGLDKPEEECKPDWAYGPAPADKATGASARLCGTDLKGRGGGTDANASIPLWGWPTSNVNIGKPINWVYDRCHLIGQQLGGTGDSATNLVTCYGYPMNRQNMKNEVEGPVRRAVEGRTQERVFYLSIPYFNGPGDTLSGIRVVAVGDRSIYFNDCFENELGLASVDPGAECSL